MKKFGIVLLIAAVILMVISAVWAIVYQICNPDMTEFRQFISNPYPSIGAGLSLILGMVGSHLVNKE